MYRNLIKLFVSQTRIENITLEKWEITVKLDDIKNLTEDGIF
jgi:hypothetical protein